MSVSDYSTTPANNIRISGINIGEGWAAADVNNAFRQLMADLADLYQSLPDTDDFVPKAGGVFTDNPRFSGRGGYHFNASSSDRGGKWTIQPYGGSAPYNPSEGDFWAEY